MLPTQKTKPKTRFEDFLTLIYGESGIGKTTLVSQIPDVCFLATEEGHNAIECYRITVESWQSFLKICQEIGTGKHSFKTFAIDTADNLYRMCSDYVCARKKIEHPSDMEFGKGFNLVNEEFIRVVTKLSKQPYGLIFISHAADKEFKQKNGRKYNKIVPTIPGGGRDIILKMVDFAFFCSHRVANDRNNLQADERVLRTKPSANYEAKDRTGKLPEILPLDLKALIQAIKE